MSKIGPKSRRLSYVGITVIFLAMSALVAAFLLISRRRRVRQTPIPVQPSASPPSIVTQITGLSEAEAAARQRPFNQQEIDRQAWRRFLRENLRRHLFTFFNLDALGVAILMYLLGSPWGAIISLFVMFASFGLNVGQEIYTKRKLDRLVSALQPQATIVREGKVRTIAPHEIVPGDMLVVGAGDRILVSGEVVADSRIVVDEMGPVDPAQRQIKQAGDKIHAGSICVEGRAVYRATDVERAGLLSAPGSSASVLPQTSTPLQKLIKLILQSLFVLVVLFLGIFLLDTIPFLPAIDLFGEIIRDRVSHIFVVAPTSLFLIIIVNYAIGLTRIADLGGLVYRAEAIEALANVSVICFGSSGTLTGVTAALEVVSPPAGYEPLAENRIRHILGDFVHSLSGDQADPILAETFPGEVRAVYEIAPFFSAYGWSGLSFNHVDLKGTYILGEPGLLQPYLVSDTTEQVDPKDNSEDTVWSHHIWTGWIKRIFQPQAMLSKEINSAGSATNDPLTVPPMGAVQPQKAVAAENNLLSSRWQRLTGQIHTLLGRSETTAQQNSQSENNKEQISYLFAYRPDVVSLHNTPGVPEIPSQLIPLGQVNLSEQVHRESLTVVRSFLDAGVKIKILTADDPRKVAATINRLNLEQTDSPTIISGADMNRMNEATFSSTVREKYFFANLTPEQQAKVVRTLRFQGAYVAMVGNNIQDIPAMRQANLSVTSQSGSQATLTLADIVLLKRSLRVLPDILLQGQKIVNGLLDTFMLYFTHITAHLLLILIATLLALDTFPYSSTQASIISVFAVTIPSIILPFWASIGKISNKTIAPRLAHFVFPAALTTGMLALLVYYWFEQTTADWIYAQLAVTYALVAAGLVRVMFVQPPTQAWIGGKPSSGNWRPVWLIVAVGSLFLIFVAITAAVPLFQRWFHLYWLLHPTDYLIVVVSVVLWAIATRILWRLLLKLWRSLGFTVLAELF